MDKTYVRVDVNSNTPLNTDTLDDIDSLVCLFDVHIDQVTLCLEDALPHWLKD